MTAIDQLKTIDSRIKANQAQYDLGRLAAKISALSSDDLRKYEYLTSEDFGYRPSVVEKAKFDYSPLGRVFIKGLYKDDQKEALFKRVENIKGKNEELLQEIKNKRTKGLGNKDSKTATAKHFLIYGQNHNFYKYGLDILFNVSSTESKSDTLEMFYKKFISLISFKVRAKENTNHKFVVLNNALNEYHKLIKQYKKVYKREPKDDKSYGWKQKYSPKNLKTLDHEPGKVETESLADKNRSDIKQPTHLKELKLNEIPRPL